MRIGRFAATLGLAIVLVGGCSSNVPPTTTPSALPSSSTSLAPAESAPVASGAPSLAANATCDVDIAVSGGYEGHVTGPVAAAPRPIGDDGHGASIDVFLEMPQKGVPTQFLFSIFDSDGPDGPQSLFALFGESSPGVSSLGWQAGVDPVSGSLATDGSHAAFDLKFGRIGVGPATDVVGTIDCPPLT